MTNKYFTLNHINNTIEGTKTALKKAGVLDTPECKELCELMNRFPKYKISVKTPKKNNEKKTYHGLSLDTMKEYIALQPNSENMLKKFEAVKRVAKAKGALYPLTKKWFLNEYPDYKVNSVSEDEAKAAEDLEAIREAEDQEAAKELEALENTAA